MLEAATFRTFLVPASCPHVVAGQASTKAFIDQAKLSRGGTSAPPPGEPHVHVWGAFVNAALEDKETSEADMDILNRHATENPDPANLCAKVFVCKIKKAYNRDTVKVHFAVHKDVETIVEVLARRLLAAGGREKRGQPPQGGLKREVQAMVEKLEEITK